MMKGVCVCVVPQKEMKMTTVREEITFHLFE